MLIKKRVINRWSLGLTVNSIEVLWLKWRKIRKMSRLILFWKFWGQECVEVLEYLRELWFLRREKKNTSERKHTIICLMCHNNSFHKKNIVEERCTPPLLRKKKRRSAKSDVSQALFPGIGKITNQRVLLMENVEEVTLLHSLSQLVQQVKNEAEDLDL